MGSTVRNLSFSPLVQRSGIIWTQLFTDRRDADRGETEREREEKKKRGREQATLMSRSDSRSLPPIHPLFAHAGWHAPVANNRGCDRRNPLLRFSSPREYAATWRSAAEAARWWCSKAAEALQGMWVNLGAGCVRASAYDSEKKFQLPGTWMDRIFFFFFSFFFPSSL